MPDMTPQQTFQVDLRGIVDLLSNHLYSTPNVFVRELLQNATDAITARTASDPDFEGRIQVEVSHGGDLPTLAVEDNGIGLTEDEVHEFLATIGRSSKRQASVPDWIEYIGQFGVGILSCFVVSDEVVVVTRSATTASPAIEWRGRSDGTYTLRRLDQDLSPGTTVYLRPRLESRDLFGEKTVERLVEHYGGLLPFPIRVVAGGRSRVLTTRTLPWDVTGLAAEEARAKLLAYGHQVFETEFFDAIPLRSTAGDVQGVAFVLPHVPSTAAQGRHRAYLKRMLLSESVDNLLPEWAYFVRCVVNATRLKPTASRESFYEDERLSTARERLGQSLRQWLIDLATTSPERLARFVALHHTALKALASTDDDFYRLFVDLLPFETSLGMMSLGDYRKQHKVVRFISSHDAFRQAAAIVRAQGLCIIDGGYTYDAGLLEHLTDLFPEAKVEALDIEQLAQAFADPSLEDRERMLPVLRLADIVLQEFHCQAALKVFEPDDLPVLYCQSEQAVFFRSVSQAKEVGTPFFGSLLDGLPGSGGQLTQIIFNFGNPLVRRLATVQDRDLLVHILQLLYVQSLLLAHQPLNQRELSLLHDATYQVLERSLPPAPP
jgi:molecular chaperone HtpG